jgi:hypothetical protein
MFSAKILQAFVVLPIQAPCPEIDFTVLDILGTMLDLMFSQGSLLSVKFYHTTRRHIPEVSTLYTRYYLSNIIRIIKSRIVWAGQVACM